MPVNDFVVGFFHDNEMDASVRVALSLLAGAGAVIAWTVTRFAKCL